MMLDRATIEIVFDAIDCSDTGEICLHRKIAPIQCGIIVNSKGIFRNLFNSQAFLFVSMSDKILFSQ